MILAEDAFQVHRQMVICLFVATTLVCVVVALGLLSHPQKFTMLIAVIAAGALGGFVSALRRLYAFQKVFPVELFVKWKRIDIYLLFYSMIPAMVGAIAAVVLYLIFASGLVEGTYAPKFSH